MRCNRCGVTAAVLSGGNGSNSTTQLAVATIDPRYGNTFTIDATSLTNSGALQYRVNILLKAAKSYGNILPGKTINILIKLPPNRAGGTQTVNFYFDSTIGNNISTLATGGYGSRVLAISLISDGAQFQVISGSLDWAYL